MLTPVSRRRRRARGAQPCRRIKLHRPRARAVDDAVDKRKLCIEPTVDACELCARLDGRQEAHDDLADNVLPCDPLPTRHVDRLRGRHADSKRRSSWRRRHRIGDHVRSEQVRRHVDDLPASKTGNARNYVAAQLGEATRHDASPLARARRYSRGAARRSPCRRRPRRM